MLALKISPQFRSKTEWIWSFWNFQTASWFSEKWTHQRSLETPRGCVCIFSKRY